MPVKHRLLRGLGAGKYLGFATQKVGRLVEEARGRGPSRTKRYTVDNGMVDVKVSVQGEQHYVKIKRKTCPPFVSGLCDLILHKKDTPDADIFPEFTPIYEVPDPKNPEATIKVFRRFFSAPPPLPIADRAWRDERGLVRNEKAAEQISTMRSTHFTGEMAKVVQILQGMNVVVPYDFGFSNTHGVFVASSGQRWIIEISNYGVVAWQMTMCRNPVLNGHGHELLSYTPIRTPKPVDNPREGTFAQTKAIAAGTYKVLMAVEDIQPFYQKSPFYGASGWAYDSRGRRAINVVYIYDSGVTTSYCYRIDIGETENVPSFATLTMIERGKLYAGHDIALKFPFDSGALYSYDTVGSGSPDPGGSLRAPVHAYYDGDTQVIIRLVNDQSTNNVTHTDAMYHWGTLELCSDIVGVLRSNGVEGRSNIPHYEADGVDITATAFTTVQPGEQQMITLGRYVGGFRQFCSSNAYKFGLVPRYSMSNWYISGYGNSVTAVSALVIPIAHRAAFYWGEKVEDHVGQYSRQNQTGIAIFQTGIPATATECYPSTPAGNECPAFPAFITHEMIGTGQFSRQECGIRGQVFIVNGLPHGTSIPLVIEEPGARMPIYYGDPCLAAEVYHSTYFTYQDTIETIPASVNTREQFRFYRAGARPVDFLPTDTFTWYHFFEGLNGGSAVAVADAFGSSFIATKELTGTTGPTALVGATDYPGAEVGAQFAFVGVP